MYKHRALMVLGLACAAPAALGLIVSPKPAGTSAGLDVEWKIERVGDQKVIVFNVKNESDTTILFVRTEHPIPFELGGQRHSEIRHALSYSLRTYGVSPYVNRMPIVWEISPAEKGSFSFGIDSRTDERFLVEFGIVSMTDAAAFERVKKLHGNTIYHDEYLRDIEPIQLWIDQGIGQGKKRVCVGG